MDINWMETGKDGLLVVGRIFTIYPLLLFMTLFMGRRSIGELPIYDFLIILSLGSVVGADIADPKIEHLHTAIAIIVIALMQKLYAIALVKFRRFGKLVSFEPIVVIKDGMFMINGIKKVRYPIDNILQMLREDGIFDIAEVDIAVLEANGKLTAYKKAEKSPVTRSDMGVIAPTSGIAYPVILEGRMQKKTLNKLNMSEDWLAQQLHSMQLQLSDVFFATVNDKLELHITNKNSQPVAPPVFH